MSFTKKINFIIQELGANNADIASFSGFDRTNVSRIRNGIRYPRPSGPTADKLINGIYLFADNHSRLDFFRFHNSL